jgi:N utilization substance protein A
MSRVEILQVADAVAREKNMDKEVIIQAIEQAIQKAGRSKYGHEHDIRCHIDRRTGDTELKRYRTVTETDLIENEAAQITVEQAQREKPDAKVGDILIDTLPAFDYGRVAAQTAKQVIMQNIREAEREQQFNEFKDRIGEIISGLLSVSNTAMLQSNSVEPEAILRRDDALPREHLKAGDRVRAVYL